jgi:HSP20 family protein
MSLVRWRPRSDFLLDPFFDGINARINEIFGDWTPDSARKPWYPALDLVEEKDRLIVRLELPGVDPKSVQIHLQGDVLQISGERVESKDGKVLKREQLYGAFQRTLQLPYRVVTEKVSATYENGIMSISMPKVEELVGRQIPVEVK